MESEQEWQFITNEIQNKSGSQYGEWSIGLEKIQQRRNGRGSMVNLWLSTNGIRGASILTQMTQSWPKLGQKLLPYKAKHHPNIKAMIYQVR